MASSALATEQKKSVTTEIIDDRVQPDLSENLDEQEIATFAYQLWEERGCQIGSPEQDWFEAERQLKGRRTAPPKAA